MSKKSAQIIHEYKGNNIAKKDSIQIPYIPGEPLIEAVNLAIYLKRPLLLKGEPGCGKTRLAKAVADELNLPYKAWYIKSTTQAQDGLYTFDAVARLRDAQLAAANRLSDEELKKIDIPDTYISYGPLGEAFLENKRTVVLIDEIDKADIDFPNDLLMELDEKKIEIKERKKGERIITTEHDPIVFITSNDEKDLPDAFLRRCLFHYIEFPKRERLIEIIEAHFPVYSEDLIKKVTDKFLELREKMKIDKGEIGKKISTSELLDWLKALKKYPDDKILSNLDEYILAPSVLIKSWDDHCKYLTKTNKKLLKDIDGS